MSHRLVKVESLGGLTVAHVEDMEALEKVPGERELSSSRLSFIKGLLVDGLFDRLEWAKCDCKEDKKIYRMNGQHTTYELRDLLDGKIDGATFPEGIPVTVDCYECDTKLDLADVFDRFDSHISTRTANDKLGIYMAQHEGMIGIDKGTSNQVLMGVAWGVRNVPNIKAVCESYIPDSAYSRGVLLNIPLVREFIGLMHEHIGAPFKEWQHKSGIIARMFGMFLDDRETAELAIEQTMCEAGEKASEFTKSIRSACARTGKDQGFFYRKTDKYMSAQLKDISRLGRDAIKDMIREVLAEDDGRD